MLTETETIIGLRLMVSNAALQVQNLCDEIQVGSSAIPDQARTALNACEMARDAIDESLPILRKLTRKSRAK